MVARKPSPVRQKHPQIITPDKALERWDDEGGAAEKAPRTGAQRSIDNDTSGMRRPEKAVKDRNDLVQKKSPPPRRTAGATI